MTGSAEPGRASRWGRRLASELLEDRVAPVPKMDAPQITRNEALPVVQVSRSAGGRSDGAMYVHDGHRDPDIVPRHLCLGT
jgi:hypothetical protein